MRISDGSSDVCSSDLEAGGPLTSASLAKAMQTNPVVVRRILAGLREAGFVRSEKGHGGGWTIARGLSAITMRDVYDAIGRPHLLRSEARRGGQEWVSTVKSRWSPDH